jgi:hypothetical protein
MNTQPMTPYPTDPTIAIPQPGYAPADPQYNVPPIRYIQRTNVGPASPPPNPSPLGGQVAAHQPPADREDP